MNNTRKSGLIVPTASLESTLYGRAKNVARQRIPWNDLFELALKKVQKSGLFKTDAAPAIRDAAQCITVVHKTRNDRFQDVIIVEIDLAGSLKEPINTNNVVRVRVVKMSTKCEFSYTLIGNTGTCGVRVTRTHAPVPNFTVCMGLSYNTDEARWEACSFEALPWHPAKPYEASHRDLKASQNFWCSHAVAIGSYAPETVSVEQSTWEVAVQRANEIQNHVDKPKSIPSGRSPRAPRRPQHSGNRRGGNRFF